jgi:hypothetical protein
MLADRAKVKEKLVELLPKFKRKINRQVCPAFLLSVKQCCGTESRGAEIKLPPGAGAEITNCGSGSFLFTTD